MAEKLRTFDFEKPSEITSSEKVQYPWDQWLDGDIWQLIHGQDFQTHPLMMERIIRTRATTRQAKVRLRHQSLNGNGDPFGIIVIQRTDKDGPAAVKKAEAKAKRDAKKAEAAKEAKAIVDALSDLPNKGKRPAKAARKVTKTPSKRPVKKVSAAA